MRLDNFFCSNSLSLSTRAVATALGANALLKNKLCYWFIKHLQFLDFTVVVALENSIYHALLFLLHNIAKPFNDSCPTDSFGPCTRLTAGLLSAFDRNSHFSVLQQQQSQLLILAVCVCVCESVCAYVRISMRALGWAKHEFNEEILVQLMFFDFSQSNLT